MYPKPNINNNLYELLKRLPREELVVIFKNRNMSFTKTEEKKNLSLIDKVYRELINFYKNKDFFYWLMNTGNLLKIVFYIFLNNGEVKLDDIKHKYGKHSTDQVRVLKEYGFVFSKEEKIILPLEYFFVLADIYIHTKHPVDEDTLIKGLYMYPSDEIKKLVAYLNNNYKNHLIQS